jgi:hypothetical protein
MPIFAVSERLDELLPEFEFASVTLVSVALPTVAVVAPVVVVLLVLAASAIYLDLMISAPFSATP